MLIKHGVTAVVAMAASLAGSTGAWAAVEAADVLKSYADVAEATYADSRIAAESLLTAVRDLVASPDEAHLLAARRAWLAARVPYMQSEGFRFGNAIVDDWEGKVNAWPLDEGLIDYVDVGSYGDSSDANPWYTANVIANPKLKIGAKTVDASGISKGLLAETLQEAGGLEANVATGYHAVEFLLWGQDLNGTGPGSGARPASDFDRASCTGGHCDRRAAYLLTAAELLVDDLKEMEAAWAADGEARKAVVDGKPDDGLTAILTGLGSLSYGELAGERMKLGLILHDPEEEHDCFSDNTHNSHYYDELGMLNIYAGKYKRLDGTVAGAVGIADLAAEKAPAENARIRETMAAADAALGRIKSTADSGSMAYDQMLGEGNAEGNKLVDDAVQALVAQARAVEALVAALGLEIEVEGSDSLDNPGVVTVQ
jgi:putative iron-regulated protein